MHSRREILAATVTAPLAAQGSVAVGAPRPSDLKPRLYRREPDSRELAKPRIFARIFCEPVELLGTVRFYEDLAATPLDQDLDLPSAGIHVVAVGPFLILALDPSKVDAKAHGQASETRLTVLAPDLDEAVHHAVVRGAALVGERFSVPHATGQRLRHAEGTLVEYLQHRPSEFDHDTPGPMFR